MQELLDVIRSRETILSSEDKPSEEESLERLKTETDNKVHTGENRFIAAMKAQQAEAEVKAESARTVTAFGKDLKVRHQLEDQKWQLEFRLMLAIGMSILDETDDKGRAKIHQLEDEAMALFMPPQPSPIPTTDVADADANATTLTHTH